MIEDDRPREEIVQEFNEALQETGKLPECPRCDTQMGVYTDGNEHVNHCPGCGFEPTKEETDYGY